MKEKIKQKALKYMVLFFLVMFVMTFVSRMLYTNNLPRVNITRVSQQSLSHLIECSGTLEAVNESPVFVPEGIKIADKKVRNGDAVSKGDTLIQLDINSISEQINKIESEISLNIDNGSGIYTSENKHPVFVLSDLRISDIPVKIGDYVEQGQVLMRLDYQYLYDKVCDLYNDLQSDIVTYNWYIQEGNSTGAESLSNGIELKERKYNKYNSLSSSTGVIYSEYNGIVTDILVRTGELTSDSAVFIISENAQPNYSFSEKEGLINELKELLKTEGKIQSPIDGVVSDITVKTGDITGVTSALTVSDVSLGLVFNTEITEDDTKFLAVGDNVSIKFRNGRKYLNNCEIASIIKNDTTGKYDVHVAVSDDELKIGEIGILSAKSLTEERYDCIPVEAVYEANERFGYIYIVDESEGFLGNEYIIRKKKISIKDKNDVMYGVDKLGESDDIMIVADSTKKLNDDQKVRIVSE